MSSRTIPLMAALFVWGVLASPPVRLAMESIMVTHALQIGLLAGIGGLLARSMGPVRAGKLWGCNRYGITGTVLAFLTLAFWLLPVSLDRALDHWSWEVGKFLSLPLLLGLPLARSWSRLSPIARGVLWANAIPMAVVMGWLYREAPVRLCNNYLSDDQQLLGLALWMLAALIAGYWAVRAFIGFQPADSGQ
ncbi:MAG: hypothetical protein HND55_06110 [Pseudomonadota bacterium]|nr:MAG: hypothetical protein HND55_06110 [Pseudomonadota bacterium]